LKARCEAGEEGRQAMTTLEEMEALQEAHTVVHRCAQKATSGTTAVWELLCHAENHISKRMQELLREEPTCQPK